MEEEEIWDWPLERASCNGGRVRGKEGSPAPAALLPKAPPEQPLPRRVSFPLGLCLFWETKVASRLTQPPLAPPQALPSLPPSLPLLLLLLLVLLLLLLLLLQPSMQPSGHAVRLDMEPLYGKDPRGPSAAHQPPSPPRDFVLWSLFNFGFLNCCCLGFAALVFSIKSRDRKVVGDPEGAASYGKTAKCLNITALVVSLILTVIIITVYYFVMAAFVQQFQEMMKKHQ